MPGQPVIVPPPKTFEQLQERMKFIEQNNNGINWYLSFKKPPEKCDEKIGIESEKNKKELK